MTRFPSLNSRPRVVPAGAVLEPTSPIQICDSSSPQRDLAGALAFFFPGT